MSQVSYVEALLKLAELLNYDSKRLLLQRLQCLVDDNGVDPQRTEHSSHAVDGRPAHSARQHGAPRQERQHDFRGYNQKRYQRPRSNFHEDYRQFSRPQYRRTHDDRGGRAVRRTRSDRYGQRPRADHNEQMEFGDEYGPSNRDGARNSVRGSLNDGLDQQRGANNSGAADNDNVSDSGRGNNADHNDKHRNFKGNRYSHGEGDYAQKERDEHTRAEGDDQRRARHGDRKAPRDRRDRRRPGRSESAGE
ncbi:hypothetical protein ERJ75_000322100 [Trypanosoma vivax]|nr:hypothetical protein TRVL_01333 [Trypanosoma vivax]KAH8617912.1 hypothetical protein ERJ75_000322100 [Trypanosoma vivax]